MYATLVRCTGIVADRLLDAGIPAVEVSEFMMDALTALQIEILGGDFEGYDIASGDFDRLTERASARFDLPPSEA